MIAAAIFDVFDGMVAREMGLASIGRAEDGEYAGLLACHPGIKGLWLKMASIVKRFLIDFFLV